MYLNQWTDEELEILKQSKTKNIHAMMLLLPKHTKSGIQHKSAKMGYGKGVIQSNLNRARQFIPPISLFMENAWLIGAYTGDGCITNKNLLISISSIDYSIVSFFRYCVSLLYADKTIMDILIKELDPNLNTYAKKIAYQVRIGASQLGPWLKEITCCKTIIPDIIKNGPDEIKLAYLSALVDTEGCVHKDKNKGVISLYIGMKDENFIQQIKELCNSLSIGTRPIRYNNSGAWILGFNMRSLSKYNLLLQCMRKRELLEEYNSRPVRQTKSKYTDCSYTKLCYNISQPAVVDEEEEVINEAA